MPDVTIRTPVKASEDPEKVKRAVLNVFPDARLEIADGRLEAHTDSLDAFRHLIGKQRILDAARRFLLRGLNEEGIEGRFLLHKQAAFTGRISFSEGLESPLGDLEVTVRGTGLEAKFKEIAPMTIRGHPVSEERAERELTKRRLRKPHTPEVDWDQELAGTEAEDLVEKESEEES